MKFFHLLDGLQKSTRMTVLGCACFLALTAVILLFLMFFPITPEEKHAVIMAPAASQQPEEGTQTYPVMEFNWDDVPHTLSTWSAGVDGFSRSLDEFTATETETTSESSTSLSTTEETDETYETNFTEASEDTGNVSDSHPPMPQTTTETVGTDVPEPETTAPVETDHPPVVTEVMATPAPGENEE